MSTKLKIYEIYKTIQGESSFAGFPCIMIRLLGCNLSCSWCDTIEAQEDGEYSSMSVDQIVDRVTSLDCNLVEVTGGEPLMQEGLNDLLAALCDKSMTVLLETNGSIDVSQVDPRVRKIVDVKCPGSNMSDQILWSNFEHINENDELKFVISDLQDFHFAVNTIRDNSLTSLCDVIFSPVPGRVEPSELAKLILESSLNIRLGLQLHKIIWPDGEPKDV